LRRFDWIEWGALQDFAVPDWGRLR